MTRSPDRPMQDLWLDAKAIAAQRGEKYSTVVKRFQRLLPTLNGNRALYVREVSSTRGGGRGGVRLEFCITALERDGIIEPSAHRAIAPSSDEPMDKSSDAQIVVSKYAILEKPKTSVASAPESVRDSAVQSSLFAPSTSHRVVLPDDQARQADARLAAIQPLLDYRVEDRKPGQCMALRDGTRIRKLDDLVRWIARQSNGSLAPRTLYRWLDRWDHPQKFGAENPWVALANRVRRDKGTSKFFSAHPRAAAFLQQKYINEGLNAAHCAEILRREWRRIEKAGDPPSDSTVAAHLRQLPRPLVTLAREGPRAYFAKHSPFVLRGPVAVMDCWVLDHRQFDVFVRNTLFPFREPNEMLSLWMTMVTDWGSRRILGAVLAPEPSSRTIDSALLAAALTAGALPRNLYWDNGKDFQRAERILLSQELGGVLQNAGVEVTCALPYRPRSKPIESWFNSWSQRFDLLFRPAWRGRKPAECPEDCREAQKQHAEFLKGRRDSSPLPADRDFIIAALQFIEEYNGHDHPALAGRAPAAIFDQQHPPACRERLTPQQLAVLFWQRELRCVQQGGCVEINSARYEPVPEALLRLDPLQGQKILVAWDPYNLGHAIALDRDGHFLGELRAQKFLTQSAHGRVSADEIRAAEKRRTKLGKHYAGYLHSLALAGRAMGWESERDAMIARGRERLAATGTDPFALAAPSARPQLPGADPGPAPAIKSFACDVTDEDAALLDQVELDEGNS